MTLLTKIKKYIKEGSEHGFQKMFIVSVVLALSTFLISLILSHKIPSWFEGDSLLKDIPTLQLKDGILIQPQNTIWTRQLPWDKAFVLQINTQQDEITKKPKEDGVYLTRKSLYMKDGDSIQSFALPKESWTLTQSKLKKNLEKGVSILGYTVIIALLILLWTGFAITIGLTSLISTLSKKESFPGARERAAVISWPLIFILNLFLTLLGLGLAFLPLTFLATLLSLFLLNQSSEDSLQ